MSFAKTYVLMLIAIPIVLMTGMIGISAGVNYLHETGHLPPMIMAVSAPNPSRTEPLQTSPSHTAPAIVAQSDGKVTEFHSHQAEAPQQDNTAAWITLISTLALAAFAALTSMFNTYMQVKLKIALNNTQASLDENTVVTKQTRTAVSKQSETVDKIKKDIDESNN